MSDTDRDRLERRLLVLAPVDKDAALTRSILGEAGIDCVICPDLESVGRKLEAGAGALLLAEEALAGAWPGPFLQALTEQPPWSDLPVLVLTWPGADSPVVARAVQMLGNVELLERPIRVAALTSAVRAALRARQRQYQIRAHLVERERVEKALHDANRRKDEFLATLAHELRNPLAPIRNSLYILRLAKSADPATESLCEMIERQVNHMVRLVDDLMELSRITRGKIELRKELVELTAIVQSAIETSRPLIEAARHQLTVDLPQEPLLLDADPVRLAQVFANLLNNAAKYTAEGGRIWVDARREGVEVTVSVKDTGIGISADMLPRVFKMFIQSNSSFQHAESGLGIGLTLVRRLVRMHGGSVEARSEGPGKGSEFVVRLPLATRERAAEAARSRPEPCYALSSCRTLVVDDNRDAADSLGLLLKKLGADVRVVHDAEEALKALESFRPAVMLMDIGMPRMNGYELARRIRREPEFRDVTLIALTGWSQEEDRLRSFMAGFDYHLIKPADIDTLRSLLAVQADR